MANLFSWFFELFSPARHTPIYLPDAPAVESRSVQSDAPSPTPLPLKNWSHPFKDKAHPLLQLTQMAKAAAGYYPVGRNGLWHGGVHFDGGTAGTLDQSGVHCLADGEVVAYRIDQHSPGTTYFFEQLTVKKPFSRNFVLVRHRLEAPKIEGSPDTPPSLVFYSLYMHLRDWAVYQADPAIVRPGFWPEAQTRRVKATASDTHPDYPGQQGLSVFGQRRRGKALALLPRGMEVTVSGEGEYRKVEGTDGPDVLKDADGRLQGYVAYEYLVAFGEDVYRIGASALNVRAAASANSDVLMRLPQGTEVCVSGEGAFRKLERVNQYVHADSLEGEREPVADRIVVLQPPIAIKAADLIGHIGLYQDCAADYPEEKLHLEVFSGDDVETFIEDCRAWAGRLPASSKTWLKFAKDTAVVAHQAYFSATQPPSLNAANTPSDADLWVPKSLLDGLPAENKIQVAAMPGRKACNWYRLEGLLHDADGNLLDGWVCEEVGVTPWVSPWSWDGFEVIFNYDTPRQALASFLRAANRLSAEQIERHGALADMADTGPLKTRLYDLIDRNRDGSMSAEELQSAMALPAHAQSLAQLIIFYESEWRHAPSKWDGLDEILGHNGSTPQLNWVAEKGRINAMSWWDEVAVGVGLPGHGQVYHLHPLGLGGRFRGASGLIDVDEFLKLYADVHVTFSSGTRSLSQQSRGNLRRVLIAINTFYEPAQHKANLYEVAYMLATVRHEAYHFPTGEYFSERPEVGGISYFNKYDPVLASDSAGRERAKLNGNTEEGDGYKYRGRGCVHLTWKNNYRKFSDLLGFDFVKDPDRAAVFEYSVPIMVVGMTNGLFTGRKLAHYINAQGVDYLSARKIINGVDEQRLIASYANKFEAILRKSSRLSLEF